MDQKLIQEGSGSYGSTDSTIPDVSLEGSSNSASNIESIANNIHIIYSNCKFLEQASKAIGTVKDNIKLRNNVQSTLLNTKSIIDHTKTEIHDWIMQSRIQDKALKLQVEKLQNSFKDVVQQSTLLNTKSMIDHTKTEIHDLTMQSKKQDKALKLQIEKLQNSFKDAVQVFSNLQNLLLIKLKRNLPTEPCPITHSEHKRVDYIYDDEEELLSLQQTFQKTLEENLEEITEREDILHKLENDVKDVNDIMRDLGTMIYAQGDTMNLIENAVEEVHGDVESGRQELEKAAEYQQKRKKKVFFLFILLVVTVIVFSFMLYFTLKQ